MNFQTHDSVIVTCLFVSTPFFSSPFLLLLHTPQALLESELVSEIESPPPCDVNNNNDDDDEADEQPSPQSQQQDDDIDWEKLAQSEPAATDIPVFLQAHAHKEAANERFAQVLDDCHSSLLQSVEALLQTVADVINLQRDTLEAMEADIKHNLICNDEARTQMQSRLEQSATAAQGLFAKLLMRVMEPIQQATTRMQESLMPSSTTTTTTTRKDDATK